MISNSTAVVNVWTNMGKNFDLLLSQRAFIHWYVSEGMEESELTDARENIISLERAYKDIEASKET